MAPYVPLPFQGERKRLHGPAADIRRRTAAWLSGLLGALRAVLRASLLAVFHALQVERATDDVVTHTRQILYTTAAHEHDRVFLQVVAFAADVRNDFVTVGQAHLGDLTQSGVRLLGG